MLDKQEKGEVPYNLAFFWDSVGSVPCKLTYEGKGGKQHTAGVLADKIGMGLNRRITSSRKADRPYTNTLTTLVQPWVFVDMGNPMAKPRIEGKGGKTIWLNSTLVFQFGNVQNSGTSQTPAEARHNSPAFPGVCVVSPVASSHSSTVQTLPSSWGTQNPPEHCGYSLGSRGVCTHSPVVWSQVSAVQNCPSSHLVAAS